MAAKSWDRAHWQAPQPALSEVLERTRKPVHHDRKRTHPFNTNSVDKKHWRPLRTPPPQAESALYKGSPGKRTIGGTNSCASFVSDFPIDSSPEDLSLSCPGCRNPQGPKWTYSTTTLYPTPSPAPPFLERTDSSLTVNKKSTKNIWLPSVCVHNILHWNHTILQCTSV